MPTTIPALRGKFGETEYWLTTMKVGEFIRNIHFPKEITGWEDLTIEERYQRDISINRVRKDIAPYFASDDYRFSGSLVLAVLNHESMVFEPLTSVSGNNRSLPALYQSAASDMGFLTLSGSEILVPLDGQHRAKAFKFAIDGTDDANRQIPGMKSNPELANDQVSVILVRFETVRARRIFNKINRYAKPTTKGDNLITDDDDAMAVMTRDLLGEDGVIPARLVRIGANTLNKNAPEFTTLATFYDSNIAIVEGLGVVGSGNPQQMNEEQRETVKEDVRAVWQLLLNKVDWWSKAIADSTENRDSVRADIRQQTLLGKPVAQLSLVRAFMLMRKKCEGVEEEELCNRLNRINWDVSDPMWLGVLMTSNNRVMAGKTTVNRAAEFIAHLGGTHLTDEENKHLLKHIYGNEWEQHQLPSAVVA